MGKQKADPLQRLVLNVPARVHWFEGDPYPGGPWLGGQGLHQVLVEQQSLELFDWDETAAHGNEVQTDDESEIYGPSLSADVQGLDFRAYEVDGVGARIAIMAYLLWGDLGI